MSLVEDRQLFRPEMRSFLMIGLLGSFTTFSTLGYETFELLRDSEFQFAFMNVAANVVLGITAVALGRIAVTGGRESLCTMPSSARPGRAGSPERRCCGDSRVSGRRAGFTPPGS